MFNYTMVAWDLDKEAGKQINEVELHVTASGEKEAFIKASQMVDRERAEVVLVEEAPIPDDLLVNPDTMPSDGGEVPGEGVTA